MKIKKWQNKVRRFFSLLLLNKKYLNKDNHNRGGGSAGTAVAGDVDNAAVIQNKQDACWLPDNIFDEFRAMSPIPNEMKGYVLLVEVGNGVEQGWVLDFSDYNNDDKVVVARYDIPQTRLKSKKTPIGPPKGTYNTIELKTFPWIFYKDLKVFSKIESGKLSDMVALVTGRIVISGDMKPWEKLDASWKKAKDRITNKRKLFGVEGDDHTKKQEVDEDEEETKIIATYKPAVEAKNPLKKEFWKRHLGTDFLVSSYLFLISSLAYMLYTISRSVDSISAHKIANVFASVLWTCASVYFVKLSYPETIMIMAYRVMSVDPNDMTFFQRYFIANRMLIAQWLFTAGFFLPNVVVILYEVLVMQQYHKAAVDIVIIILAIPLAAVFNVSAMPDAMRANGGRGSSFFFDLFLVPVLCLKSSQYGMSGTRLTTRSTPGDERYAYWKKHLGTDVLAGAWLFAVAGIIGGIGVLPLMIRSPFSLKTWFLFWSNMPFSVGSILLVRASYPENMNTSIFFSSDFHLEDEKEDAVCGDTAHSFGGSSNNDGEQTPLLS